MSYEDSKCPYRRRCKKFRDGQCFMETRYKECGNFIDMEIESLGEQRLDSMYRDILNKLDPSSQEPQVKKGPLIKKKCPFKMACYQVFVKSCKDREGNGICLPYECEDCEFRLEEYGELCDTPNYIHCNSYDCINTIREGLKSQGVYNTEDLKNFYGSENYDWLGGYIRAAFFDPKDNEKKDNDPGDSKSDRKQENNIKTEEDESEVPKVEENAKFEGIKSKDHRPDEAKSQGCG